MSAHAGADTGAGDLTAHRVGGATFEPLHQCGVRHSWRVGDEQVPVVGLAVEFDLLGGERAAHRVRGLLAEGAHLVGEHRTPVVGHEHQVRVQQRYAVAGASIGLGCQWSALQLWCADALPVSHRTDTDPAADAGAGVRVLPGGVQRRAAGPRRCLPRRDKAVGQRDSAPGDHRRPRPPSSGAGWPRFPVWRWCSRSTTPVVRGGTSSTHAQASGGAAWLVGRA